MTQLTREVPWSQLGVDVSSARNSQEAMQLAGLNWDVESKPIFDEHGNELPNFKANVRSDDDGLLGIVTDKYHIVQNADAFKFTDDLVNNGNIKYERAGVFRNGKSIWLLGKMPETKVLNDEVAPYIVFINSHDGSGSVRVAMTPIRIICSNALNVALKNASRTWSARHMGHIQTRLTEAQHTLGLANNYMVALNEEAERLANEKISDTQVEQVFALINPIDYKNDSERKIKNIMKIKQQMFECYAAADISKYYGTMYGLLNAIADMTTHQTPTRVARNFRENNWLRITNGHPTLDTFYKTMTTVI